MLLRSAVAVIAVFRSESATLLSNHGLKDELKLKARKVKLKYKDNSDEDGFGTVQSDSYYNALSAEGVPWSEDEHRLFLLGLQKVGKGDWRGISRNFVKTRTPTQVASHAQKYFLRRNNHNRRRRRSSLFDITTDAPSLKFCLLQHFFYSCHFDPSSKLPTPGLEGGQFRRYDQSG
ncbi:hypothetical protein BUALT_Bualt10G0097700 [Buddleja alternifolia]|uniref:Uncharacterized protein n=1 Tax=Buddleja alternifolia TaxID=168488 RepID=A0AAV6WGK5_9LAMI|nr:hypothetical protein BUALT_Bualt14G0058400 [Buddleja alternifolia]KAG8375415.1 hypothetical protein BUALT_Bualt10G0097700 [Buddleja alternifolia]